MKIILFTAFVTTILSMFHNQDCNSVEIKISIRQSIAFSNTELIVKSGTSDNLNIPSYENLIVGYREDEDADCYFEVFDFKTKKEVLPTGDYQYFRKKIIKLETLKMGTKKIYNTDFLNLYNLNLSNKYKARIIFKLSKYNKTSDIISNWVTIGN